MKRVDGTEGPQKAEFKTQEGWEEYKKQEAMGIATWKTYFAEEWDKVCKALGAQRKIVEGK